jgi:prepilin-type N-terminal cleavage/methylation domain-containing protein
MKRLRIRAGFTLVEMLVAMVIFAGLIAITLTLFTSQIRAFTAGSDRAELTLAGEFASRMMSQELRTAGTNVRAQQPWLVYGGVDVVAFHADLVSRVVDNFAVYIDPDAPTNIVQALHQDDAYVLPRTAFTFPDTTYWAAAGILAPAELIIFYFEPDASTARTDDFVLQRRVNDATPDVIARNVLRTGTLPFFEYLKHVPSVGGDLLQTVPAGQMPLIHSAPLHLSPADEVGTVARIDSVRAIRFNYTASNGRTGDAERRLDRTNTVWLRNGGLAAQRTCGGAPLFSAVPTATIEIVDDLPAVRLTWAASIDEADGEEDVIRYVVWRTSPLGTLGDPLLSVPAGETVYQYLDRGVQEGEDWIYSVAAQDCTPTMSSPNSTGTISIPVTP